jgi:hypothetical protein
MCADGRMPARNKKNLLVAVAVGIAVCLMLYIASQLAYPLP